MNTNRSKRLAMIAAITGNAIFGFSFLASKIALNIVEPIVLLSARFSIAFIILTVMALVGMIQFNFKGKNMIGLVVLGIFQPVVYFFFENYGILYTNSSIGGIIISLIPIATFFIGSIFLKEKFRSIQLVWAIVSVIGVCILSVNGSLEEGISLKGLLCLFGAVASGAIYTAISRKIADDFTPMERTYSMFFIATIAFVGIGLVQTKGTLPGMLISAMKQPTFALAVLYLAVCSSIVAFFMLNFAVTYLPIRQSTSFTSLTSVISVAAGALILSEPIGYIQLVGIVFIIIGVFMVNRLSDE